MITSFYAGLCGLLLVVLYARVSQRRLGTKIGTGTGGDSELEQRVRAHGNFVETVPLVLILLYLVEQTGASPAVIHGFGASFVIARVAHAQGMSSTLGRSAGRFYSSVGTLLITAGLAIWLIAHGIASL